VSKKSRHSSFGRKKRRSSSWLAGLVVVSVGLLLFLPIFLSITGVGKWRDRRMAEKYEKVEIGWSRADVQQLLGSPNNEGPCGKFFREQQKIGCSEEFVYDQSYVAAVPVCWWIGFDEAGRVMSKETRPVLRERPRDTGGQLPRIR
jgi:hypothetical protein